MNLVGTLEDLISINSVTGDEESILDFIEDFLIKNNFNGEVIRNDGGIIAVPLDIKHDLPITILASSVSLTPGTVSCDLSEDGRTLLIHALHIDDAQAIKADIARKFEQPLKEIFA